MGQRQLRSGERGTWTPKWRSRRGRSSGQRVAAGRRHEGVGPGEGSTEAGHRTVGTEGCRTSGKPTPGLSGALERLPLEQSRGCYVCGCDGSSPSDCGEPGPGGQPAIRKLQSLRGRFHSGSPVRRFEAHCRIQSRPVSKLTQVGVGWWEGRWCERSFPGSVSTSLQFVVVQKLYFSTGREALGMLARQPPVKGGGWPEAPRIGSAGTLVGTPARGRGRGLLGGDYRPPVASRSERDHRSRGRWTGAAVVGDGSCAVC